MQRTEASIRNIFFVFLKMGTFAFGGVYSMLAFFEKELVNKRKWLSHEDFAESVVIGQLTPGPPIINTGIFIGYRLKKLKGAITTVIGQVLPSFILILVIAYLYISYNDIPLIRSLLKGIGAAVVGLISSVVYNMSRKFLKDYKSILIAIAIFLCLAVFKINPIILIVISGIAGVIVYRKEQS
jgi:chromate transporter